MDELQRTLNDLKAENSSKLHEVFKQFVLSSGPVYGELMLMLVPVVVPKKSQYIE